MERFSLETLLSTVSSFANNPPRAAHVLAREQAQAEAQAARNTCTPTLPNPPPTSFKHAA